MLIKKASVEDADVIGRLFDQYRQFYQQAPDLTLATAYIKSRLSNDESVIFLATEGERGLGFVQLYPTFCSVEAAKIYVLYDLFVAAEARKQGVGKALMLEAQAYATQQGAKRIDLNTAIDNTKAQALYKSLGYVESMQGFKTFTKAC